jgi:hypothetical protein
VGRMRDAKNDTLRPQSRFKQTGTCSTWPPERIRQRTVKNGHILFGFGVPRRNPKVCASGCLRELDGVGGLVPGWVPAGWHVIGKLDCARQGVWIPCVLAGHSVGNNGTVRTGERM